MELLFVFAMALWSNDNAEFIATSNEQLANDYQWKAITCRRVDPELPSITMRTPTGKDLVCFKLQ